MSTSLIHAAVVGLAVVALGCAALTRPPETPAPVGTTGTTEPEVVRPGAPNEIPVGQELDVRLQDRLSSATATVEDRFQATTVVDLMQGDRVLVPAGSEMRGVVTGVDRPGRIERRGRMTLSFDQITIRGQSYPVRAMVTQAIEGEGIEGEAARVGAGAGVGAIVGGILGGLRGALAGIVIGAGGTILATEGEDVELPPGTILRVRFDSPLVLDGTEP